MNEFVGTVPFLRFALWFDMETFHFHIAQTGLFKDNLAPMKNCPGMQVRSNKLPDNFSFCGMYIYKACITGMAVFGRHSF